MKYKLKSKFRDSIRGVIAYKKALGYSYVSGLYILKNFDKYCFENFKDADVLTKEIGLKWAEKKGGENESTRKKRIVAVRQLAKYIHSIGGEAFMIPAKLAKRSPRYIPHIYTKPELRAFFCAADHFEFDHTTPIRHLVIPVIFRLIYCCGLRPGEALKLLLENANLTTGAITIIETKGHKDRVVVMADDLLQLCITYRKQISKIYPHLHCRYFFPNHNGTRHYNMAWLRGIFWRCWNRAGISGFNGNKPRVYDFRHTFTTNRLHKWMCEGKDIMAYFPYLSAYLGHAHLSDTAYYIHLVPEYFPQMAEMNMGQLETLIPEASYED